VRYEEEQAGDVLQAMELLDLSRALQASMEEEEAESTADDSPPALVYEEMEEKEEEEEKNDGWSREDNDVRAPQYHGVSGRTVVSAAAQSPLQYLQLFLPPETMALFAQYTTDYAQHITRDREWSTTAEELYAFVAAHIYMGICDLPSLHMYWSEEWGQPELTQLFSRHRFEELLRFFQVVPLQDHIQSQHPLARIRSFANSLNARFPQCFTPSQYMTIDETMIGFKGRSAIKQYIPSKPHKWGYKVYCLASESYLLRFEIYEGKELHPSPEGPVHDLVIRLMTPYQHKGFILFTDQWFTSPTLLNSLRDRGIRLCGSVGRRRSGLPRFNDADVKHMARGDSMKRTKEDMTLVVWKDQKAMHLLFNHVSSHKLNSLKRWGVDGDRISLSCPQAIHDYFFHARSVDVIGQLHYSYLMGRKSKRSLSRLIWWAIDMCIINAFILFRLTHAKVPHLQFRQQLMHELMNLFAANRNAVQLSRGANVSVALARDHYSDIATIERECVVCSGHAENRKRTTYICHGCNVHVCIGRCFALYHSRV
jgi:hypothetical protein